MDNEDRTIAGKQAIQPCISHKFRIVMAGIQHIDIGISQSRYTEKDCYKLRGQMNIPRKYQLMVVVGIALLFLLYGVSGLIFKFEVDKKIENNVSFVLMMIAAVILLVGKKKKKDINNETANEQKLEDGNNQSDSGSSSENDNDKTDDD